MVCPRCAIQQALEPEPSSNPDENEAVRALREADIPSGFGRYKLLEEIGSGGFGVVYAAEQTEPIHRRVAIKVVKVGMDTRQIVARFEAERQALAMMDHPNIARVFDAGATAAGRPFFVMELVRGSAITRFCDEHRLDMRKRIALLKKVCLAIQHAHHKGVIHRDLKPSNVLVSAPDGEPEPKVIDFGIAKATQMQLTDKTLYTQFHQFLGTPAYMSPEQAGLGELDVDARSDVYSLGALLYELLTGDAPFDAKTLSSIAPDEARRKIREDNPVRPSTRVSRLAMDQLTMVAARRGIETRRMRSELKGDLDRIVMKALEKDRTRRYPTAAALAEDLQHFLDHEPVSARPPGFWYVTRKAAQRHRLAFGAAAAVALSLLAGAVVSLAFAIKARELGGRAQANERVATNALAEVEQINTRLARENYRSAIQLAQARIRAGEPHAALAVLQSAPARLRGWEWGYLMGYCPAEEGGWDTGHGNVSAIALCQGDRRLLTGGEDWRVILWDIRSRQKLWEFRCKGHVRELAVAPDGLQAAAFSARGEDGEVVILDMATGQLRHRFDLPWGNAGLVWHRDGLFSFTKLGCWRIDPNSWRIEKSAGTYSVAYPSAKPAVSSGDNPELLVLTTPDTLIALNPATLETNRVLYHRRNTNLQAFVVDTVRNEFVWADQRIVWRREGAADARPLYTNQTDIRHLQILPDHNAYVVAGGAINIVRTDGALGVRWGVPQGLRALTLTADGRVLIGDEAGFVRSYRPETMAARRPLLEVFHPDEVRNISFAPDSQRLAFMSWKREASFHLALGARSPKTPARLETPDQTGHYHSVGDVPGFVPGSGEYASCSSNALIFYDVSGPAAVRKRTVPIPGRFTSGVFDAAGRHALVSHERGAEWVNIAEGKTRPAAIEGLSQALVALSPDGATAAAIKRPGQVDCIVWQTSDDRVLWRHQAPSMLNQLALHPSGELLALALWEGQMEIWKIRSGTLLRRFPSATGPWGLRFFGRAGERLLALLPRLEMRIWDWQTGDELLSLPTASTPFAAAVSPDGLALAVASHNPGVTVHLAIPWWAAPP